MATTSEDAGLRIADRTDAGLRIADRTDAGLRTADRTPPSGLPLASSLSLSDVACIIAASAAHHSRVPLSSRRPALSPAGFLTLLRAAAPPSRLSLSHKLAVQLAAGDGAYDAAALLSEMVGDGLVPQPIPADDLSFTLTRLATSFSTGLLAACASCSTAVTVLSCDEAGAPTNRLKSAWRAGVVALLAGHPGDAAAPAVTALLTSAAKLVGRIGDANCDDTFFSPTSYTDAAVCTPQAAGAVAGLLVVEAVRLGLHPLRAAQPSAPPPPPLPSLLSALAGDGGLPAVQRAASRPLTPALSPADAGAVVELIAKAHNKVAGALNAALLLTGEGKGRS